jgi:hypothetical protein
MTSRGRDRGAHARPVDVLAAVIAVGGLALLAPLEYGAGRWLGLGPVHAGTVTVVIEGTTGLAILARRHVALALSLSTVSALVGMAQSGLARTGALARGASWSRLTDPDVVVALGASAVLTGLAITALAVTHRIRQHDADQRAAVEQAAVERACRAADADRAHQLELERAAAERAEQERRDAERFAAAERAHELEMQRARAFAEQERERITLSREADARAREEAAAERERLARERAADELRREELVRQSEDLVKRREEAVKRREREDAEREAAVKASRERLAGPAETAAQEWRRLAESGEAPDAEQLAGIRGCALGTARNLISQWRRPCSVERSEATA